MREVEEPISVLRTKRGTITLRISSEVYLFEQFKQVKVSVNNGLNINP